MLRYLALVLGATWFFPVSCTVGTISGTRLLSQIDTRYVANDDLLHNQFLVALQPRGNSRDFRLVPLDEVKSALRNADVTLLPFNQMGNREINAFTTESYSILESEATRKLIETVYSDDDITIWSRYWASSENVEPVSSRLMEVGYMFQAFIWSFCGALLLYFIGRKLRFRFPSSGDSLLNYHAMS